MKELFKFFGYGEKLVASVSKMKTSLCLVPSLLKRITSPYERSSIFGIKSP